MYMYSTKDAELSIEEILKDIDEYDIYAHYMGQFKIGRLYNSPLRKDKNPSFAVFKGRRGNLLFKDHGTGECGNSLTFIKSITGYNDSAKLLSELKKIRATTNYTERKVSHTYESDSDTEIGIVRQPFTEYDKTYWKQFHINMTTLKSYDVFSIKYYLCNGIVKGVYRYDNPMFAYKVNDGFKIYRPLGNKYAKWRSNLKVTDIQGLKQLPELGNELIITKSLKDVMVLKEMGYNAISPSSETTFIPDDILDDLKSRYSKLYILYDRDTTGVKQARAYSKKYHIDAFFINKRFKAKDISDAVKLNGFTEVSKWLKKEIKCYNK